MERNYMPLQTRFIEETKRPEAAREDINNINQVANNVHEVAKDLLFMKNIILNNLQSTNERIDKIFLHIDDRLHTIEKKIDNILK